MTKTFVPKPIVINLGGRRLTLRADLPKPGTDTFPILMVSVDTTLHAFVRSGPPEWVNKGVAERRQYITSLIGPENVSRIVIHPDMDLWLEMGNEHFILHNREVVEVFSLKSARLAEYLDLHDQQIKDVHPVVKQLVQIEHVLDDTFDRTDVWNSQDLCTCLDAHPTVDATHRIKVRANSLQCSMALRNEGVTLAINFTTDGELYSIGRGELRTGGHSYHYTVNGVDGLKLDYYPHANKKLIEDQAERLIRKLVDYVAKTSTGEIEPA